MKLLKGRRSFGRLGVVLLVMAFAATSGSWGSRSNQAWAASPGSGTVSESAASRSWGGSTVSSAPAFSPGACQAAQNCDVYTLNVNISSA